MKKFIFLLFIFGIGKQNATAQVPGYQGKRFSVGYNVSTFVFADGGLFGIIDNGLRLSYKSDFSVNYSVSRKTTMGLSIYYAKQKYLFDETQFSIGNGYGEGFTPVGKYAPCKLFIFELHFQFFRKNLM